MITVDEVRKFFTYNPKTGELRWAVPKQSVLPGSLAGTDCQGYIRVKVDNKLYYAHNLIWLFVHGEWPPIQLDHKNRVRNDNRLLNLRPATTEQNRHNSVTPKNNTSGVKGVHWRADKKRWAVEVYCNKVRYRSFHKTFEAAVAEVQTVRARVHKDFAND